MKHISHSIKILMLKLVTWITKANAMQIPYPFKVLILSVLGSGNFNLDKGVGEMARRAYFITFTIETTNSNPIQHEMHLFIEKLH